VTSKGAPGPLADGASVGAARAVWPAVAAFAACAAFLIWRIQYGVELTDESFYLATARQFAMGGRPLVDSWSALQSSAWLVSPLVRVWEAAVGGSGGLVLAMRWGYVALSLAAAAATIALLRRAFSLRLALVASGATLVMVPFVLPALSYNTLAIGLVAIGSSLVAHAFPSVVARHGPARRGGRAGGTLRPRRSRRPAPGPSRGTLPGRPTTPCGCRRRNAGLRRTRGRWTARAGS
jgi:hypothetical protein